MWVNWVGKVCHCSGWVWVKREGKVCGCSGWVGVGEKVE